VCAIARVIAIARAISRRAPPREPSRYPTSRSRAIRVTLSDKPTTLFRVDGDTMRALCARGARCGVGAYVYTTRARDRVRSNAARRHRGAISRRARVARRVKSADAAETVGDASGAARSRSGHIWCV
jgi:hypothetical protein